jgi:hypothetical protein
MEYYLLLLYSSYPAQAAEANVAVAVGVAVKIN